MTVTERTEALWEQLSAGKTGGLLLVDPGGLLLVDPKRFLEAVAASITAAATEATAAETERCALVAMDDLNAGPGRVDYLERGDWGHSEKTARRIAAAIRARPLSAR